MKEGPDESQGREAVEPESKKAEESADKAIDELVVLSAACAVASIVFGGMALGMGLPFAAGGVAAGLFAMRRVRKSRTRKNAKLVVAVIGANCLLAALSVPFISGHGHRHAAWAHRMLCGTHMSALGRCLTAYAEENGAYPPADQWCDYVIKDPDMDPNVLICMGAQEAGSEARCHYAMNPNARPDCAGDVVLLFETKGGWNLCGGRELMTFENHEGQGCNILFVDGHVEFWKAGNDPNELNWGQR